MDTIGTMRALDQQDGALRVEDVYDTSLEDLWQACTQPARLARWVAEVTGDLREGGAFRAAFTSSWVGPGRVDVCDRPHHLMVTLLPGTDDEQVIEAWLTPEDGQSRLVVEERGISLTELHYHAAGWQAHLEDLHRSLVDQPSAWEERWNELTPVYASMPIT